MPNSAKFGSRGGRQCAPPCTGAAVGGGVRFVAIVLLGQLRVDRCSVCHIQRVQCATPPFGYMTASPTTSTRCASAPPGPASNQPFFVLVTSLRTLTTMVHLRPSVAVSLGLYQCQAIVCASHAPLARATRRTQRCTNFVVAHNDNVMASATHAATIIQPETHHELVRRGRFTCR